MDLHNEQEIVLTDDYLMFYKQHEQQLLVSGVPQKLWPKLYIKLKNQIFDASEMFTLLKIDYDGEERPPESPVSLVQVSCENGLNYEIEEHIYLIDHAWSFRINKARQHLLQIPSLLNRMCNIMGIEATDNQVKVSEVCKVLWKYCQTYSIENAANVEDRIPIWYIMDEVGCGIQHSDDPNFRVVPFVYIPEQITYTLIFPIKDLEYGDLVTRDFVESVKTESERAAHLIPWIKNDLTSVDFTQYEPAANYFLAGHIAETLPINVTDFEIKFPDKIKVFSEYCMVNKFLTNERFELTDDETLADIFWYTKHFKSYDELSKTPNKCVNQFPFENVITIKDLLSIVCRRNTNVRYDPDTLETFPAWFPVTYNLATELEKFVSYFQNREKLRLDNHWICKPWNLARGLDIHITNNLDCIVRLPATGPKIAQKYIQNPVVFHRPECGLVKFDVRYVILLKSVTPLKAYVYNNFFLRFSNKPFELKDFDDYEKHFTVMNYSDEAQLHHLPCADFLVQWDEQYSTFPWRDVEQRILKMLKEVFQAAISLPAPSGIAPSPQSRAVYAADIILSWDKPDDGSMLPYIQPKLLEINWTPDCKRACDYYPNFYNDIFSCLFLNDESSNSFTCL